MASIEITRGRFAWRLPSEETVLSPQPIETLVGRLARRSPYQFLDDDFDIALIVGLEDGEGRIVPVIAVIKKDLCGLFADVSGGVHHSSRHAILH